MIEQFATNNNVSKDKNCRELDASQGAYGDEHFFYLLSIKYEGVWNRLASTESFLREGQKYRNNSDQKIHKILIFTISDMPEFPEAFEVRQH